MICRPVARFERYILTPLSFALPVLAVVYLFHRAWLVGVFLLFVWFCIAAIGQSLHRDKSVSELSRGGLTAEENIKSGTEFSHEDAHAFARPLLFTSFLCAISAGVLLRHHDYGWLVSAGAIVVGITALPAALGILFARTRT